MAAIEQWPQTESSRTIPDEFLSGHTIVPRVDTAEMRKSACAHPGGGGAPHKVCCGAEAAGASGGVSMTGTAGVLVSVHAQQSLLHVPRV